MVPICRWKSSVPARLIWSSSSCSWWTPPDRSWCRPRSSEVRVGGASGRRPPFRSPQLRRARHSSLDGRTSGRGPMLTLDPIDSVEVQVLVDNVTDNLSSVPSFVETEFASLGRRRRGTWVLGGSCLCCAAHGLSCLITTHTGSASRTLLFDTGPEDR